MLVKILSNVANLCAYESSAKTKITPTHTKISFFHVIVSAYKYLKEKLASQRAELARLRQQQTNTTTETTTTTTTKTLNKTLPRMEPEDQSSFTSTQLLERKIEQLQKSLQLKTTAYNNLESTYKVVKAYFCFNTHYIYTPEEEGKGLVAKKAYYLVDMSNPLLFIFIIVSGFGFSTRNPSLGLSCFNPNLLIYLIYMLLINPTFQ